MKATVKIVYGMAITFLIITVITIITTYSALASSASEYGVSMWSEWGSVIQTIISAAGGFLGFACVLFAIGTVLQQLHSQKADLNESKKSTRKK